MSGPEPPPTDAQVQDDLAMIVGGHFTPDAIGPDAYDEVIERVQADPGAYLDAFRDRFLGVAFDPLAQSELYPTVLLEVLLPAAPDEVRDTAAALARQYDAVLVVVDRAADPTALAQVIDEDTVRMTARLDDRRRELRDLLDRGEG